MTGDMKAVSHAGEPGKRSPTAQMNFDPRDAAMPNIVALMRFPGPDYFEVLRWLHEELRPESYVEIGVCQGHSLRLAMPPTVALGIDPSPEVDHRWRTRTQVLPMASSEFFSKHSLAEVFGTNSFSLAFIDGLHQFEQAIDDIFNLEVYALPHSVIAVHDTIPLDEHTSARERRTTFHTGDVWKVLPFLKQYRPDLEVTTVRTGPSGLTLIRRLNGSGTPYQVEAEGIGRFQDLTWEFYKEHRHEFLETIPNDRDALVNWLCNRNL